MTQLLAPMLVVAVALVDEAGRVLLQQRPLASAHGGLWEFPGGKVEAAESPQAAAVRELAEELGVVVDAQALEPVGFASGQTAPGQHSRPLVILLYACRSWQGVPRALEASQIAWVDPPQIASLDMPPLDYPLAQALGRHFLASDQLSAPMRNIGVDQNRNPS